MKLQIVGVGESRRHTGAIGGHIEYVSGSGDKLEIKIMLDDVRAIWITTDATDRDMLDALIGRATAVGQGEGHPAFDAENLQRVAEFRASRQGGKR